MSLKNDQISTLLQFVASVSRDELTCDDCLEHLPELAELPQEEIPRNQLLEKVQAHLKNCPCCAKEYAAFLEALGAVDED